MSGRAAQQSAAAGGMLFSDAPMIPIVKGATGDPDTQLSFGIRCTVG